jgi:hypothetical protein
MMERMFSRFDGDVPGAGAAKVRAYQLVLALVICAEYWSKYLRRWGDLGLDEWIALALVTVLAGAVVHGPWRRAAFAGFVVLQAWYVWSLFPHTGNHRYLELIFAALFAFLDDENEEERELLLRGLRFMVVVVLFYSGLQKLVHGYYFRGQYLAYALWRDNFRSVLEPLLSVEEAGRLAAYGEYAGEGPFLVSTRPFLLLSNAVWVLEMGLGLLLVPLSTRRAAWAPAFVFVVATEIVARELMFGIEFACAILLFARSDLIRRAVWPVAVLLGVLLSMRLGLLPEVLFH